MNGIYLDAHANARLAPEALDAMVAAYGRPGNPHAANAAGLRASAVVEQARAQIGSLISASANDLVFTSGATEANNLAIMGLARAAASAGNPKRRIATSALEHPSVSEAAKALVAEGFSHIVIPVDARGQISLDALIEVANAGDLLLTSMTWADGEVGAIQPLSDITNIAHAAGAIVHSDASQAAGRIDVDVDRINVDALSVSSHKIHGPAGIGALYLSPGLGKPKPLMHGGGQERSIRPGTIPTALAAGFGAAASMAKLRRTEDQAHCVTLVQRFEDSLLKSSVRYEINGGREHRLPGSVNIRIDGIDGDAVVDALGDALAVSTGSACSSGKIDGSQALRAIGLTEVQARSSLRCCFDRYNTVEEADAAAEAIAAVVKRFGIAAGEFVQ
jgi:cysteine desulfurase